MHKQQLLITFFSSVLLLFNASGMDKQICPQKNFTTKNTIVHNPNLDNMSLKELTTYQNQLVNRERMETFIRWSPIIKIVIPTILSSKKPKEELDLTEEKLENKKSQLKRKLNEKKQKAGFWTWFLHYATKIGSILTGGFVHWGIGNILSTFDTNSSQTHELKKFTLSTLKQSGHPAKCLGVAIFSRTPLVKKIVPPIPPAPPKNPPLKELANPLRLMLLKPLVAKFTVSTVEACEQSFKEYLDEKRNNISPQLIIKRTCLLFAQKNLREYFVPLTTVAIRTCGPEITKEIRQTEHDLAIVNKKLGNKRFDHWTNFPTAASRSLK